MCNTSYKVLVLRKESLERPIEFQHTVSVSKGTTVLNYVAGVVPGLIQYPQQLHTLIARRHSAPALQAAPPHAVF